MVKNLWKLDRNSRGDARGDGDKPSQPVDSSYQTVGVLLRLRREERGEDLRYVAQILRIRYPYLKAIEDSRPDELPGPTYAIGFVRTYADHLGLDSDKMVQRFKAEAAGLHARADLHFPAPLPEGKIPSGAVLVVAVVLAAFVYGAWIYLSSREQQVAEIVPQLPNRISEIIKGKPASPEAPQTAGDTGPAAPGAASPAPAATPEPSAARETAAAPASPAATPAPKAPEAGSGATATTTPPATSPVTQSPSSAGASSDSEAPQPPTEIRPDQLASRTDAARPEAAPSGLSDSERGPPRVYGEEHTNARIVIHAAADSWVEVRDTKTDELLLTRVLFKGDSYRVPDRAGLTLLTGNAGGLRIAVDGQDAPAIGPIGAVRRNVTLEAAPLKAGKASSGSDNGQQPLGSSFGGRPQ